MTSPLLYTWTGTGFDPLRRFHSVANATFVIGQNYKLDVIEDRSAKSHSHYFATLHDIWLSIPEDQAERWLTEEHFRKWCLIKTGFADSRQLVCSSKAEARRVASFVRPCDEYAVVAVTDCVVTIYTAKSQSMKAMGRADFQASKQAVLEYAASLVGVEPPSLSKQPAPA